MSRLDDAIAAHLPSVRMRDLKRMAHWLGVKPGRIEKATRFVLAVLVEDRIEAIEERERQRCA